MEIATTIAKMSKCVSFKVGAILVKDSRIISTGYNGTPKGFINCEEMFKNYDKSQRDMHHNFSEMFEIHAELNAILCAASYGISINGCDLYCTLHPCNDCLKMICNSGIKNIFYKDNYDKSVLTPEVTLMLEQCKINLIKID